MGLVPWVQALWEFVRLCSITLRGSVGGPTNYHGIEIRRATAAIKSEETNWSLKDTQSQAQLRSSSRKLEGTCTKFPHRLKGSAARTKGKHRPDRVRSIDPGGEIGLGLGGRRRERRR